jgi:crotonobetainyl-CoA:carnitine CoA-transferase CaiB-like acyl-CoA transferase
MWIQAWEVAHATMTDEPARRSGAHHPMIAAPYGVYQTADGGAFFFAVAMADESWDAFWTFVDQPEVVLDERWGTAARRIGSTGEWDGVEEIRERMRVAFASKTTAEWEDFLAGQPEIIYERVQSYDDVVADPMVAANGYLTDVEVPHFGTAKVVSNVVRLSDTPGCGVQGPPPTLGQHTHEIMSDLGFTEDQIAEVISSSDTAVGALIADIIGE